MNNTINPFTPKSLLYFDKRNQTLVFQQDYQPVKSDDVSFRQSHLANLGASFLTPSQLASNPFKMKTLSIPQQASRADSFGRLVTKKQRTKESADLFESTNLEGVQSSRLKIASNDDPSGPASLGEFSFLEPYSGQAGFSGSSGNHRSQVANDLFNLNF